MEAESIQQLWPELPFFRVTRADEHEASRMARRDALALHDVAAAGRRIQQNIHQVIVQQIDLVYVKKSAVGSCKQSRLEGLDPAGQGPLDVQRTADPVLGRTEREIYHGNRPSFAQQITLFLRSQTLPAKSGRLVRVAAIDAALDPRDSGQ